MKEYIELSKPRVTWLILMSTAVGYWFGFNGPWHWLVLLNALVGTGLIASGTFTLNQWYEREADGKMRRTERRPLPSGRMLPGRALWFGLLLSVLGFVELYWGANPLTAWLGLFTQVTYLGLYPPLNHFTPPPITLRPVPLTIPPPT